MSSQKNKALRKPYIKFYLFGYWVCVFLTVGDTLTYSLHRQHSPCDICFVKIYNYIRIHESRQVYELVFREWY